MSSPPYRRGRDRQSKWKAAEEKESCPFGSFHRFSLAALMLLVTFSLYLRTSFWSSCKPLDRARAPQIFGGLRGRLRGGLEGSTFSLSREGSAEEPSLYTCARRGSSHLLLNLMELARAPPLSHPRPSAGGRGDRTVHSQKHLESGEEERKRERSRKRTEGCLGDKGSGTSVNIGNYMQSRATFTGQLNYSE